MSYEIEKDIEKPKTSSKGAKCTYPLGDMEVNDSFFVETEGARAISRLRSTVSQYGLRNGSKFFSVIREANGCRVFRVG